MLKAHASVIDTRSLICMKINFGHRTVNAVGVKSQTIGPLKAHLHDATASGFACDIDFNGDY